MTNHHLFVIRHSAFVTKSFACSVDWQQTVHCAIVPSMDDFPGIDGFLGTRAPLVLDLLFLAMFVVVLVLAWSVYQVKVHRRYQLHKSVQILLGVVLLAAVAVFEVDIQLHGWEERAAGAIGGNVSST